MGALSRTQVQVLIAAAANEAGELSLNENLCSGNAAATVGSLLRLKLVAVITRPDGSRWIALTEQGHRRVRNGIMTRRKESVARALAAVTDPNFGRIGRVAASTSGAVYRRPKGKMGKLSVLLEREEGATVTELMAVTGWKAASVYSTLSTHFGPRWGRQLVKRRTKRRMIYRMVR